jgi:alkylated DNA repair dioxygenase AlkB
MQCALFGSGDPSFDAGLRGIRRVGLSEGAWFEHHSSWLEGHERVFRELEQSIDWQSHRRLMYEREVDVPRLVARAPTEGPLAGLLRSLARTLEERYRRPFPNISLAYYRDGNDSVAFHGDKLGRLVGDAIVATLSVGEPRRFLLKPNLNPTSKPDQPSQSGGSSLSFDLGWGDLFVMGGTCQRTWQHAIPKRSHAHPRISIMFRPQVPDS